MFSQNTSPTQSEQKLKLKGEEKGAEAETSGGGA